MDKWEYIRRADLSEKDLNEFGAQGWELVGIVNDTSGDINTTAQGQVPYFIGNVTGQVRTRVTLILKRRKP